MSSAPYELAMRRVGGHFKRNCNFLELRFRPLHTAS